MKMWIARNEGSPYCTLYKGEKPRPYYDPYTKKNCWTITNLCGTYMCLDVKDFPEVTFENSPMEVELKLVKP